MELAITVTYAQLCVFDPSLQTPYNDWADGHVAQGFSWRPGSVSFATDSDCTSIVIDVTRAEEPPDVGDVEGAIRVPFFVPPSGSVEIGSIMSGDEVPLPSGSYALYFLPPQSPTCPFRLIFVPGDDVEPAVLNEGRNATAQQAYLMVAEPA